MKQIILLILTASTLLAGSFQTGIGAGMTYAIIAPKIGYEFDNGLGLDLSLSYFAPKIDYTSALYYSLKYLNEEVYIGPRITFGKREMRFDERHGFEASFLGLALNCRVYFTVRNYLDLQFGFEGIESKYYHNGNIITFEPSVGMSYGYDISKIELHHKQRANLNSYYKSAIITGQVLGYISLLSGIIITGAIIPELYHPDMYGFTYSLFGIGTGSICFGSFDIIVFQKLKYNYL